MSLSDIKIKFSEDRKWDIKMLQTTHKMTYKQPILQSTEALEAVVFNKYHF